MPNYPDSLPNSRMTEIEMCCKACDHIWFARAIADLGATELYDDNDYQCPECKEWND